jgi:hypothetical protein
LTKCPYCLNDLSSPKLFLSRKYPCYKCKNNMAAGIWLIVYEENYYGNVFEHEQQLPLIVTDIMKSHGIELTYKYSQTANLKYWRQKCPHCNAAQGDYFIEEFFNKALHDLSLLEIHETELLICEECSKILTKEIIDSLKTSSKCIRCGKYVSEKVANYCSSKKNVFHGYLYCYDCQRIVCSPPKT